MAFRESTVDEWRRGRVWKRLVPAVAAGALVVFVLWIWMVPRVVRGRLEALTGCGVEAAGISINPFTGRARVVDFRLHNPPEFPTSDFIDLRLFAVEADLFSYGGERLEIPSCEIDLTRVTIVTARDGTTNTAVLRRNIEAALGSDEEGKQTEDSGREFWIGELVVRIGVVELVDYSRGRPEPTRRTIEIGSRHRFTDVTDASVVVRPLLTDLTRANAGELLGSVSGLLPEPFRNALTGTGGILQETGKRAGDAVKKLIDSLPLGR